MRICLMVEGQEDVNWEQWTMLAEACETSGLEGLFRSDHYASVRGRRDLGSLDAWATLAALATKTERIRLGTLVSPATFRHPSVLARNAVTVDHISNGRVEVGMGAGWFEAEHRAFGFPFPDTSTRMDVLAEQLEIVHRSWTDDSLEFAGTHYTLSGGRALPGPVQRPHPPLIVGGSGGRRSVGLAARWADEYNTLLASPEECRARHEALAEASTAAGREPAEVGLSLMCGCIIGSDDEEVRERAAAVLEWRGSGESLDDFMAAALTNRLLGTPDQIAERLTEFAAAGVRRVMLQHLIHTDLEAVRLIGSALVPRAADL